jgi:hypothetical protein
MAVSLLLPPSPATASELLEQERITLCTSLRTGYQLISKTGKCNERIYEARTWYQKGAAPSGTPGSIMLELRSCISKKSAIQVIRMRADCNPRIHRTALWQRPLGPPLAPSINSVVMGVLGSATLNITAPIEDGGSKVTSYLLTSTPGQIEATFTPAQIKEAKVIGLSPGSTYSFSVVAINEQGPSASSIPSSPALAPTTPGAPSITKVTATGTNSAQLSFTAPLDDGGSPITSYVATSSPGGLKTTLHQSTGGTINITNLSHSTTYTFTLTANNAAGPSLSSAISTSITTETPPPPPPPEPVAVAPSAPTNTVISVAAIAGVTAPVTGATPVSTTTAGTGYTGSVSWSGSPATFAGATIYTATITLTATSGYTLTGVNENFFTVAGATTVTNSANSGVVTAIFPATEVGAATKVAITRASVGTQRGAAFTTQPQVTVQDSGSNTVTSSSAVVTATVSAGGTLVGTTTATASSGVATFTGLGVDGTIGTTYTITYTVSDLTVATATVTLTGTTCDGTTFTCQVGDTGPGGGIVFYVASEFFTQVGASGSMCTTACKYLEAAPSGWANGGVASDDPERSWATGANQEATVPGADGTAIGTGYQNSLDIVAQIGNESATSAAVAARGYTGGAKSDWHLPSKDELNQMCKWAKGITGVDLTTVTTVCTGGTLNSGSGATGFVSVNEGYWSSSEYSHIYAWFQSFNTQYQDGNRKFASSYVRPVRAFGTPPTIISEAAIAGVTAPVTGATPVTTTTAGTGYTGSVSWSESPATFAVATIYTATITLTATSGYTLSGVTENFFTVAGATTVTHSANSGVITAVFPATVYQVGDTGPGGGKIFYVATTSFACGPERTSLCTYLEVAPSGWANSGVASEDPRRSWATDINSNRTTAVTGADGTAIGDGYRNSLDIVAQTGNVAASSAAVLARSYSSLLLGVTYADWYLPSKDELNFIYQWAKNNGGVASHGFEQNIYWSSTEASPVNPWHQTFSTGKAENGNNKGNEYWVRPVRAF